MAGPRGERFNALISARLKKLGFVEDYMGGGTYGYNRDDGKSVITITSGEDPEVAPQRMTDSVLIGVAEKDGDTIAEFFYPSLRVALESMRIIDE